MAEAETNRVFECEGPDSVLEAAQQVLYEGKDLAVVHGIITVESVLRQLEKSYFEPALGGLYKVVPQLKEVDKVADDFWKEHGFKGYDLLPKRLTPTNINTTTINARTDYGDAELNPLSGPLSCSFCTRGGGTYLAQRPEMDFKLPNGCLDLEKWRKWKYTPAPIPLRSRAWYQAGDVAIIMNHPQQTYHQVKNAPYGRVAVGFEYLARLVA